MILLGRLIYWLAWPFWIIYFKFSNHRARVLVISGDKVLLVRGILSSGNWSLPGGGVKRKENIKQTAARELYEETKVEVDANDLKKLSSFEHNSKKLKYSVSLFWIQLDHLVEPQKRNLEIADAGWFKINELNNLNLDEDVDIAIKKYLSF